MLNGILRGSGRQLIGSIVGLSTYSAALVGCAALAFGWGQTWIPGIKGIWVGISVGAFVDFILLGIVMLKTDWESESEKAVQHLLEDKPVLGANSIAEDSYVKNSMDPLISEELKVVYNSVE